MGHHLGGEVDALQPQRSSPTPGSDLPSVLAPSPWRLGQEDSTESLLSHYYHHHHPGNDTSTRGQNILPSVFSSSAVQSALFAAGQAKTFDATDGPQRLLSRQNSQQHYGRLEGDLPATGSQSQTYPVSSSSLSGPMMYNQTPLLSRTASGSLGSPHPSRGVTPPTSSAQGVTSALARVAAERGLDEDALALLLDNPMIQDLLSVAGARRNGDQRSGAGYGAQQPPMAPLLNLKDFEPAHSNYHRIFSGGAVSADSTPKHLLMPPALMSPTTGGDLLASFDPSAASAAFQLLGGTNNGPHLRMGMQNSSSPAVSADVGGFNGTVTPTARNNTRDRAVWGGSSLGGSQGSPWDGSGGSSGSPFGGSGGTSGYAGGRVDGGGGAGRGSLHDVWASSGLLSPQPPLLSPESSQLLTEYTNAHSVLMQLMLSAYAFLRSDGIQVSKTFSRGCGLEVLTIKYLICFYISSGYYVNHLAKCRSRSPIPLPGLP